jgi:hypothetical protein
MLVESAVVRPRFDEADAAIRVLAEPRGENASCGAPTDDDHVEGHRGTIWLTLPAKWIAEGGMQAG